MYIYVFSKVLEKIKFEKTKLEETWKELKEGMKKTTHKKTKNYKKCNRKEKMVKHEISEDKKSETRIFSWWSNKINNIKDFKRKKRKEKKKEIKNIKTKREAWKNINIERNKKIKISKISLGKWRQYFICFLKWNIEKKEDVNK